MTYKNRFIPVTAFALAISLGGSMSASDMAAKGTNMKDQDRMHQNSSSMFNKNEQSNSRPMSGSDVLGMNIDNATNEKVGEIDEIFINSNSGEVLAMVVSTGGFLGMGQEQTLISPQDLRFNGDRTLLQTSITKEQIENAPRHKDGETSDMNKVRPLGKTASADWDVRQERAEMSPNMGRDQQANSAVTSQSRTDRNTVANRTDRNDRTENSDRNDRNQFGIEQANSRGLALSDLIGMDVENREGDSIGEVEEVYLNSDNTEVVGVVVSTGGFLGMGDRQTLFGIREMSIDSTTDKVVLDYNREQIRGFPEYTVNDQSVFSELLGRSPRTSSYNARSTVDGNRNDNRSDGRYATNNDARTGTRNVGSTTLNRPADKTVFDQGNSSEEIAMTASIRTAIREDDKLSSSANNVTIITENGKVVLRGEVDSATEKTTVESIAHNKAGRQNVVSELVVAAR